MDDEPRTSKPQDSHAAKKPNQSESARAPDTVENLFVKLQKTAQRIKQKQGLGVRCPACGAPRGERCRTNSNTVRAEGHFSRQLAASKAGE